MSGNTMVIMLNRNMPKRLPLMMYFISRSIKKSFRVYMVFDLMLLISLSRVSPDFTIESLAILVTPARG